MRAVHVSIAALLATLLAVPSWAQPPEGRGGREGDRQPGARGEREGRPPMFPLMAALDADRDGEVSSAEIENAVSALKTLDDNDDGKLTRQEMLPGGLGPRGGRPAARDGQDRPWGPPDERWRPRDGRGRPWGAPEERVRPRDGRDRPLGPPDRRGPGDTGRREAPTARDRDGGLAGDRSPEFAQRMFARLDANDDGVLDPREFRQMARGRRPEGDRPQGDQPRPPRRPERPDRDP
jgi:hypothetical protein